MNIIRIAGKFLDQPIIVAKFKKSVPYILASGGALHTANQVRKADTEEKQKTFFKTGVTMLLTISSALVAPKIVNKIFQKEISSISEIKNRNKQLINNYLENNKTNSQLENILNKGKENALSFKDLKTLLNNPKINKDFINKLIPEPENISSKEIFSEIGRLSLLGFIPVLGGITGGIIGDYITNENWKNKIANKIKEGTYQYLANIFLCNIGAGIALGIMEKTGVKNKSSRALGMIAGIILTGVIGGSAIANIISNKIINPLFGNKNSNNIYNERKPEALDIGLHLDDIATVAVMSGLKWIEPALPIMYSISGYRAGIGYRNVNNCKEKKET